MARKAKEFAAVLIQMYTDHNTPFVLSQHAFKDISGKGKCVKNTWGLWTHG